MITLFIICSVLGISIVLLPTSKNEHVTITSTIGIIASCIILAFYSLFWVANYMDSVTNIQKYYAVKTTIEEARKSKDNIERTAFAMKMVEINQELASTKY